MLCIRCILTKLSLNYVLLQNVLLKTSWKLLGNFVFVSFSKCGEYDPTKDPTKQKTNGVIAKDGPLFDELSIPFIDASPTNTPRLGRSVERLGSFFKGSIGRSRGSLSSKIIINSHWHSSFVSFFYLFHFLLDDEATAWFLSLISQL